MFCIPVLVFELTKAIIISVIIGLLILGILSYGLTEEMKAERWKVVAEHMIIALAVIVIAHYTGDWISSTFG